MTTRMADALYRVVCGFVPPDEDADHKTVTWWRFKIFALLIVVALVLAAHMSVSHGLIGAGFASSETVREIQIQLIEDRILESQDRFCSAWSNENVSAQRYSRERRERLRAEYRELTGYEYPTPTCEELGYSRAVAEV